MEGPGSGTESSAKAKEGTLFPSKPKKNGVSSITRFKGEILKKAITTAGVLV